MSHDRRSLNIASIQSKKKLIELMSHKIQTPHNAYSILSQSRM